MKIVCDSTALIGLAKIGNLELLEKIFGEIFVPNAVFVEVVDRARGGPEQKRYKMPNGYGKEPSKIIEPLTCLLQRWAVARQRSWCLGKN